MIVFCNKVDRGAVLVIVSSFVGASVATVEVASLSSNIFVCVTKVYSDDCPRGSIGM